MSKLRNKPAAKQGICASDGCYRSTAYKSKAGNIKYRTHCSTCRSKKTREDDPMRYAWINLKNHAKARKIPFMLPFKHFRKFCVRTEYHLKRGKYAEGYTVDRRNIDPAKGIWYYHISNLQTLTLRDNSIKRSLEYDYVNGSFRINKSYQPQREPQEDDYF